MGSMVRLITLRMVLAVALIALVCMSLPAQTESGTNVSGANLKVRPVPDSRPPAPFSSESGMPAAGAPIEYRSVDQMTEHDTLLAANAESSIGERAGYIGLEFNQGKWSYRQVVCPALRNHIFLRFMRNNGTGDVSLFTASIPRNGEGRVRIIPIQMRGYSLFSPAPINALTISAFNHIRAEEDSGDAPPDWLGTGLCYAALAGGHPQPAKLTADPAKGKFPAATPAQLALPERGGAVISFTDVAASPKVMEWTITFSRKGRLLKATHSPVGMLKVNPVPQNASQYKSVPVPPTTVN